MERKWSNENYITIKVKIKIKIKNIPVNIPQVFLQGSAEKFKTWGLVY